MHIDIRPDDLTDAPTRELAAAHLAGMHENTPAESVHALDLEALRGPDVSMFSAWVDGELAGIGALAERDGHAELKSMRVADPFLGRGIGRAILRHLVEEARARGIRHVRLETGSTDDFVAARSLYLSEGFVECAAFPPYAPDPLSTFMTRELSPSSSATSS